MLDFLALSLEIQVLLESVKSIGCWRGLRFCRLLLASMKPPTRVLQELLKSYVLNLAKSSVGALAEFLGSSRHISNC